MAAVDVESLTITYGHVTAVDDLSFQAEAGEVTCVLGPNGAGKTSTLEALEGLRRPSAGRLRVIGLDPRTDQAALTERIGVMLQEGGIHPAVRVREVLRHAAALYPNPLDPGGLIDRLGLAGLERRTYRQLSGGEQQRLALALALVSRPQVAFLDEPTAGVDPAGRQVIRQVVADLRNDGVAVLLTTHDLDEAERVADRVVIVVGGRLVGSGTVEDLTRASGGDERVRFRAPAGLDRDSLVRHLGGTTVVEVAPGEYVVATAPTPRVVAAITAWLADHDLPLADLRAGRQRLEDVYLRLTADHEAADADASPARTGPVRRRSRVRPVGRTDRDHEERGVVRGEPADDDLDGELIPRDPGEDDRVHRPPGDDDLIPRDPGDHDLIPRDPGDHDRDHRHPGDHDLLPRDPGDHDLLPSDPGDHDRDHRHPGDDDLIPSDPGEDDRDREAVEPGPVPGAPTDDDQAGDRPNRDLGPADTRHGGADDRARGDRTQVGHDRVRRVDEDDRATTTTAGGADAEAATGAGPAPADARHEPDGPSSPGVSGRDDARTAARRTAATARRAADDATASTRRAAAPDLPAGTGDPTASAPQPGEPDERATRRPRGDGGLDRARSRGDGGLDPSAFEAFWGRGRFRGDADEADETSWQGWADAPGDRRRPPAADESGEAPAPGSSDGGDPPARGRSDERRRRRRWRR